MPQFFWIVVVPTLLTGLAGAIANRVQQEDWRQSGLANLLGSFVAFLIAFLIWRFFGVSL